MGGNPARSFSLLGAWARQSATLFCTAYSRSAPADMCHELQKSKRVGRERCTHAATMWIYGMRFWYRYMKSWPFLVCLGFLCAMAAGAPVDAFGKVLLTDVPVWQVDFRRRWRVQVVSSLFFVFFCPYWWELVEGLPRARCQIRSRMHWAQLSQMARATQAFPWSGWVWRAKSASARLGGRNLVLFRETKKFIRLCIARLYQASLISSRYWFVCM